MKHIAFIICLLFSLYATAQKKVSSDIKLKASLPNVRAVTAIPATISITNVAHRVVKQEQIHISLEGTATLEISALPPGPYTVNIRHEDDTLHDITLTFRKTQVSKKLMILFTSGCNDMPHKYQGRANVKKPVIYLYPDKKEDIDVKVNFKGALITTIPAYNNGWHVSAGPDGTITNYEDGSNYPYLFWEGYINKQDWQMHEGFVVKARDCKIFLDSTLKQMGLSDKERNEYINFWMPELRKNKYNLIHFAGSEYEDIAVLTITPKPDAILRVFMVFSPADKYTKASPQHFSGFGRKGFTVVDGEACNWEMLQGKCANLQYKTPIHNVHAPLT